MTDLYERSITYLRLSVTERCNLRCRYCMPAHGICKKPSSDMLTEEEMILAVRAASELGITKVRITGGEPLVKKNILSICEHCASLPDIQEVCLTTNGILLSEYAISLKSAGVSRINLSLDTLDAEKYRYITRCGTLQQALFGLQTALQTGFERIKINVVLIGGFNENEIPELADLTRKYPIDVRFIELMPMQEKDGFRSSAFIPTQCVLDALPDLVPCATDGGVAKLYRLPGASGRIGLISPISHHFCAECNRIRLTADGRIKPCLHSGEEFPIKGMDYDGMLAAFRSAILAKPAQHAALSALHRSNARRNMNQIGG